MDDTKDLKWYMLFPCLAFGTFGKIMGGKQTMQLDSQPLNVVFTVLYSCVAQKPMKRKLAPPCSPKMAKEGTLTLTLTLINVLVKCS